MKGRSLRWNGILVVMGLWTQGALCAEAGKTQHLTSPDAVPEGLTVSDWASIRAAHQVYRHQVVAVEGGYEARNPGQQWRIQFDGRGFLVAPNSGGWRWGLELRRYGFAGHEQELQRPAEVKAKGGRVTYRWDASMAEWFENEAGGLEHGFTIERRPAGESRPAAPLEFEFATRGGLAPKVAPDGGSVRFIDGKTGVINYTGLKVWDAAGKNLPARFVASGENVVRLAVEERGARYPITIDPIAQQAYLKASNTDAEDLFGISVAIAGDTVVVGANGEDSNAVGVNGDESDNNADLAGAAYVFVRNGTVWSQQAYLKASNTDAGDYFGFSVAISGDTVVVGAIGEDSSAMGVNGNQADNSADFAGAVYVFVRNGTVWSQQAYLKASNTDAEDSFGFSVAIAGDTVVVGAADEGGNAVGVNGDESDNSADFAGAAYVFVRNGTTWSQQAYLKASNTDAEDSFGFSVAISGETVVVGAVGEASNTMGVNGDETDNSASKAGAAYVFVRDGTAWSQQAYLKASNTDAGDFFGVSVAIAGDTVAAGASFEDSNAVGVNGGQTDNSAVSAGAAYVFFRNGTTWSQQAYLKASNTDASDAFGVSVAISGETLVVGASHEASNATGVNGNQADNSADFAGAAYVFFRNAAVWSQQAYLKASNSDAEDFFGVSVAIAGDTLVVGANGEGSNATGVNGNQSDNSADFAGAAYVFAVPIAVVPGSTFTVTTLDDHDDGMCNGGDCTLREAINAANTAPGTDRIIFAPALMGTIQLGAPLPDISDGLVLEGPGAERITLRRNTGGEYRILTVSNGTSAGPAARISGLTLTNGLPAAGTFPAGSGGGILNDRGDLLLSDCKIEGNNTNAAGLTYGGGVFNRDGWLNVNNSTFTGNGAAAYGGAIANDRSAAGSTILVMSNSTLSGNSATANYGGAIYNAGAASGVAATSLLNCTLSANSAEGGGFGGALYNAGSNSGSGTLLLVNCTLRGNSASNGGALYNFNFNGIASAIVRNSIFETGAEGPNFENSGGAITSEGMSVSNDPAGGNAGTGPGGFLDAQGDIRNTDPQLDPAGLGNHGGPTATIALLAGSSAINAANSVFAAPTDQRGYGRSGAVDMGAFEFNGTPPPGTPLGILGNISTRMRVETGDNVLIGGFIITGTQPKKVLMRAIGPSLPLVGVLGDPTLELHDAGGALLVSNDNWMEAANKQEIIDTTISPPDDLESAILATLDPGLYTAIMRGVNNTTGIGLVEAYDLDSTADSELANISTRGLVQTGDNVMIGGFIIVGDEPQRVLVRAIGPSLPLAGTLTDPTLELFDGNGDLLASNDDWRDTQQAEIMATMIPPADDAEAAILQTLPPALYTAIVRGKNGTTGVALVEVYNLGR